MIAPRASRVPALVMAPSVGTDRAGFGPTLTLVVTLAVAAFLALMAVIVMVSHPQVAGLGAFAGRVNQQNQSAKSLLYLAAFAVILPAAVIMVPRLADAIAGSANAPSLPLLAAVLAGSLAAVLILVRLSSALPWSDGLKSLLSGVVVWSLAAAVALVRAASERPWPALLRLRSASRTAAVAAGVLLFGTLLCLTSAGSLHALPLALGALVAVGLMAAVARLRMPSAGRWPGRAVETGFVVLLALAIANVVVFKTSGSLPNIYAPPGVIQNQQDYLLGSANQLLGGGALLLNVPVSQYGVGLVYFLGAWFHLVPIGYGTLGFLDSVLTVLFYIAGYCVLRSAGVARPLAIGTVAVAVVALVYGLQYPVGSLPETGPLRFGLPMGLVLARVAAARWPRHSRGADAISFCLVGISAVWAFEAFAYTVLVLAAIAATQAWLRPAGRRRRWLLQQAALALGACVSAHVVLALATLVGTGQLPDWGQYLDYLNSFLLGGEAGLISYGFSPWSPGIAVDGAAFASAAALLLLVRRSPAVARTRPPILIGLAGTTTYAIALVSYTDNRSSTYLLLYVALPLVLAGALWLAVALELPRGSSPLARHGGLGFALAVVLLLISAAWPSVSTNFSQTALARAYPGGGLRSALHRLWHPPPIDPRAPAGVRLLDRYLPGKRVLILLPTVPDLGVEILMRSRRVNSMFIGDPVDDSLVFSAWMPRLAAAGRGLARGAAARDR